MRLAERRNWKAFNRGVAASAKAVTRVATHLRLTENARRQLLAACRGLRHDPASLRERTNYELARRYGISKRSVQYWRRAGCPFDQGPAGVADWLSGRRAIPLKCREKLARELKEIEHCGLRAQINNLSARNRAFSVLCRRHTAAVNRRNSRGAAETADLLRQLNRIEVEAGVAGLATGLASTTDAPDR